MCANYETYNIAGKKRPTLHREMIWQERGLRRGYVLCHEEIPIRLNELQAMSQKSINHLIVLVDLGMAETLFSPLNPRHEELGGIDLAADIDATLNHNAVTIKQLVNHGLQGNPKIKTQVARLTHLIPQSFYQVWQSWNRALRDSINFPNNSWGGQIRRDIDKDARYYAQTWGLMSLEQLLARIIDQQYGLTATIGDWLAQLHNLGTGGNLSAKSDLILLDTIPGPDNPAHAEFIAYNLDAPSGTSRLKTPILRPLYNLVLLSDPAVTASYLPKTMEKMIEEANNFC